MSTNTWPLYRCVIVLCTELHEHVAFAEIAHLFDIFRPVTAQPILVRILCGTCWSLFRCGGHDYPLACDGTIIRPFCYLLKPTKPMKPLKFSVISLHRRHRERSG